MDFDHNNIKNKFGHHSSEQDSFPHMFSMILWISFSLVFCDRDIKSQEEIYVLSVLLPG